MAEWFRKRRRARTAGPPTAVGRPDRSLLQAPDVGSATPPARSDGVPPEQPIPLVPIAAPRTVRLGEVLPAVRRRSPISIPAMLRIPKRTVFAAGMVAGLAAPALVRHVVLRSFLETVAPGSGQHRRAPALEAASVEIIRVTGVTARRGHAAELVGRLLERAIP